MLPEERPRHRWQKALAIVIVIALVLTAVTWYWYDNVRSLTLREVIGKDAWAAGTRDLEDRIANVTTLDTTYGPAVRLDLASNATCPGGAVGDPAVTYRVGDTFRTTMHFRPFTYNGHEAVWAPEVACPFPGMWMIMNTVLDAISTAMGTRLIDEGTSAQGWTTYRILTPNGDSFPADRVNLSLREESFTDLGSPAKNRIDSAAKWIVWAALEYVQVTGGYLHQPVVDGMDSLARASRNGTLRFVDANADGQVGDGDALQVRMNATAGGYQSYLLQLGGGMRSPGAVSGIKYVLNGPNGPYEMTTIPGSRPWFQLVHVSEQLDGGTNVTSTFEVGRVFGGATRPASAHGFTFVAGDATLFLGPVTESPVQLPGGIAIDYSDRNGNGLLDTGDRFAISGLQNRTKAKLELSLAGGTVQSIEWIAGYGHFAGQIPNVGLTAGIGPPYEVRASVPAWHPELALNRTLAVSLWENSTQVLNHAPLANGTLGAWANGTLSFEDRDGDGFLSPGDTFRLQGLAATTYRLKVSLLWDAYAFSVNAGP